MKSSELILNEDGSLYHLGLLPNEVSKTIITVGDPSRVEAVSKHFDRVELKKQTREFVTHTGFIGEKKLTVISTGIGTDNIDIVWNELHALFNHNLETGSLLNDHTTLRFIRLGTSGTVQKDIEVDTILVSSAALGFDGLLHFYPYNDGALEVENMRASYPDLQLLPEPYWAKASPYLLDVFSEIYTHKGITITAPGFYAPQGRNVTTAAKVPHFTKMMAKVKIGGERLTNIEMETAGIYGLSRLLGHEAISLSAILANRNTGVFSKNPQKAVNTLVKTALGIICDKDI